MVQDQLVVNIYKDGNYTSTYGVTIYYANGDIIRDSCGASLNTCLEIIKEVCQEELV